MRRRQLVRGQHAQVLAACGLVGLTVIQSESRIVFPGGAAGLFGKVGLVDLPEWVDQLWGELRFAELAAQESGDGFQRLFQRVMKAVDGESFLDVRPIGKFGDFKCDGWDAMSHTCYAVYGPFTRKTPAQVHRKIAGDLHGAVRAWPEMRNWRLVHNDQAGVSVLVAAALVSLRDDPAPTARNVAVLPPWGPKDLWWLLRQAPPDVRASVLGAQPWSLNRRQFQGLVGASDDPVSVSAGRSVAQLVHGFAEGGLVDPWPAPRSLERSRCSSWWTRTYSTGKRPCSNSAAAKTRSRRCSQP